MAKERKYTGQFSVVATETEAAIYQGLADTLKEDKAPLARMATDRYFGLEDGELVGGETLAEAIERIGGQYLRDKASLYAITD